MGLRRSQECYPRHQTIATRLNVGDMVGRSLVKEVFLLNISIFAWTIQHMHKSQSSINNETE